MPGPIFTASTSTPNADHKIAGFQMPISLLLTRGSTAGKFTATSTVTINQISQSVLRIKGSDTGWKFDLAKSWATS